ncbi:MAG TPA: type II toxin-antitoxin system HicA family toxin [Candidatus Binatia bacterium]|nr:type II toxin-antitoxin system HicA family toxin [Candidatus Binatia bacterium]
MAVDRVLLEKARRTPHGLAFDEALRLSRQLGFEKVRHVGGHRVFRHPQLAAFNLQQNRDGRAKAWQVRRLVEAARALRHA